MSNLRIDVTANVNGAVDGLEQVRRATQRTDQAVKRATGGMKGLQGSVSSSQVAFRKFAMGGAQQAGYQIGDFAVQVANGTSKMQAFGQQAPQLLQIFGPVGAVVGAAVAIFAAFAVVIQKTKDAAKDAEVEIISFGAAVGRLEKINTISIAENLSEPARVAMSEYSGLLELMREVAQEQRTAALSKFAEEAAPAAGIAELQKSLDEISRIRREIYDQGRRAGDPLYDQALKQQREIIADLTVERSTREIILSIQGKTRDEAARSLSAARDALEQSGLMTAELRAQLHAFAEQNGLLEAAAAKAEDLTDAAEEGADATASAAKAAGTLKEQMSFAASQARAFATAISAAPAGLQAMKNQTAIIQTEIGAIKAGYTEIGVSSAAYKKQRELELGVSKAKSKAEFIALATIINKDVEAFEARERAKEQLAGLRTSFVDFGSSGGAAVSKVTQKINKELSPEMERLKTIQDTVSSAFESGFMSMVDGTKSVKDAFKAMASDIIKELYRIFVVKKITGMISDFIGGFGSAAPTTSLRPVARSFAGGGYTGNGARAGGLDGKGGYMAMVHPKETVVDHTRGGGAGGITVVQNINVSTGVQQTVRTEIRTLMPQIAEAAKSAVADAKLRGGSYGRSFA